MFDLKGQTAGYDTENEALVIIDQTLLPAREVILSLTKKEEIFAAIKELKLRGAPCIGVSMAIALSVLSARDRENDKQRFYENFINNCSYLVSSRPTAVNLFWAADVMKKTFSENLSKSIPEIKAALKKRALEILDDDILRCRKIGEYGAELLKGKTSFLTHCNAGRLACIKYGTALAPIYVLKENGADVKVYADETRPLLQGARLTAYELAKAGIDTTVICDNMASYVLSHGLCEAVITGADRIAENGDTANKIGTSGLAVIAKHYNIPFYVAAPFSTVDFGTKTGNGIEIEMRDGDEISEMWYSERMTPKEAKALNPAFDVTDSSLITAFITERGVIAPEKLRDMKDR